MDSVFPAPLAIVDLETTGGSPTSDRITEIGIVRMTEDGRVIDEWHHLVDPGVSIPRDIQSLTGITDAMVRGQPRFEDLAEAVRDRLDGCLFVAHNARFDYGFVKNAFSRIGQPFTADVLCTVRLSRKVQPDEPSHGLDALVDRWQLQADDRHRALGDARLVAQLIERWMTKHDAAFLRRIVKELLKIPSLPPQLPADSLKDIPDGPGVYVFHGVNDLPLYVGKSITLRDRVRSHFSSDYRNANDARLSAEVRRISWERTGGELGALLLESHWVKTRFPLLNRALRMNREACVIELGEPGEAPRLFTVDSLPAAGLAGRFGPFKNKRAAKGLLEKLAAEHGLCWNALGIERREGPCFARQVRKCAGCCTGHESPEAHHARLAEVLSGWRVPAWPFDGPVVIREEGEGAPHLHLVAHWCHLGSARGDEALDALRAGDPPAVFDADIYKLLRKWAREQGADVTVAAEALAA